MKQKLLDILVWIGMVLPMGAIVSFMWIGAEYVIDKEVHFGYVDIFMVIMLVNMSFSNIFIRKNERRGHK